MDINEIARRAGVSRATVSRYLNDGYVSDEKRLLIQHVIEETGYVPSRQAQQLRTGTARLVGIIIPKINSQSISRMVAGITEVLPPNEYHVILADTNNDPAREVSYLQVFGSKTRVDGVILIATVLTEAHREAIAALSVPIVILGQDFPDYPCVCQDDYHAMLDVARIVLRTSAHPAYLGVIDNDKAAGRRRRQGFLDACAEAGLRVQASSQRVVGFDADSGYFGAERILEDVPETDAIVCATDIIAYGAMMCMREYGRDVPRDVQITGIGDSLLTRILHPSLTTVHLPFKTAGIEAAHMLLERMAPGRHAIQTRRLPYDVYVRNSTR